MNIAAGISVIIGIFLGFCYGLFFVNQQRKAQIILGEASNKRWAFSSMRMLGRFLCFGLLFLYYHLQWSSFNFILLVTTFLGTFWLVILNKKV